MAPSCLPKSVEASSLNKLLALQSVVTYKQAILPSHKTVAHHHPPFILSIFVTMHFIKVSVALLGALSTEVLAHPHAAPRALEA
jgi:hypothetical protein